jgi:hypothetical protein
MGGYRGMLSAAVLEAPGVIVLGSKLCEHRGQWR